MSSTTDGTTGTTDATSDLDPQGVSLRIDGAWNDRDAASLTGLRPGVLLRTSNLAGITDLGRARLAELGVTDVVDLRSDVEAANQGGDAVGPGVTVHRLPITPGGALAGQVSGRSADPAAMARFTELVRTPGWAHELMVSIYQEIVTSPEAVEQLVAGLRVIAQAEGAVVVHCSAGKDRTGVLVALAALIAGADQEAVETDYLYSNHATAAQAAVVPPVPGLDPALLAPILGVHTESLDAALAVAQGAPGGVAGFVEHAGLETELCERVRARLSPVTPD